MKIGMMLIVLVASVATGESKFESAIMKGKQLLFAEGNKAEDYQNAVNYFERVANKESEEWLPRYYQSLGTAFLALRKEQVDEKEQFLQNSLEILDQADEIEKNSETIALRGFIMMLQLSLDPATRGQTLSPIIFGKFNEAIEMNPENPRAHLFLGQMEYGTAQFLGIGFDKACELYQKSIELYEKEQKNENILPDWGFQTAEVSLKNCEQ